MPKAPDFLVHEVEDTVGVVVVEDAASGRQTLEGWLMAKDSTLKLKSKEAFRSVTRWRSTISKRAIPSLSTAMILAKPSPTSPRAVMSMSTTSRRRGGNHGTEKNQKSRKENRIQGSEQGAEKPGRATSWSKMRRCTSQSRNTCRCAAAASRPSRAIAVKTVA